MDNFVPAALIVIVLFSIFYQPIKRDLAHAKTGKTPAPGWLDLAAEAVLDRIDRILSKIFSIYEKISSKK